MCASMSGLLPRLKLNLLPFPDHLAPTNKLSCLIIRSDSVHGILAESGEPDGLVARTGRALNIWTHNAIETAKWVRRARKATLTCGNSPAGSQAQSR